MEKISFNAISIDPLPAHLFADYDIKISVLRLDKMHPVISGNKWFKLRYYLDEARQLNKHRIVTFGGTWSNHIIATAAACRLYGFSCTGIIRGEEPLVHSPTLQQANDLGMQLVFIGRSDYKRKKWPEDLPDSECYEIPEGGFGAKGAKGAASILDYCTKENYSHIACAAGTGTMLAGLCRASIPPQQVIGVSVLKNNFALQENIKMLINGNPATIQIIHDFHFGCYAKYTRPLIDFINDFYRRTGIPSDFVYTGKLFFAIADLVRRGYFPSAGKLLLVHSGGLQGNASLDKGTLIF